MPILIYRLTTADDVEGHCFCIFLSAESAADEDEDRDKRAWNDKREKSFMYKTLTGS